MDLRSRDSPGLDSHSRLNLGHRVDLRSENYWLTFRFLVQLSVGRLGNLLEFLSQLGVSAHLLLNLRCCLLSRK